MNKIDMLALMLVIAVLTLLAAISNPDTIAAGIVLWLFIGTDIVIRTAWAKFINSHQGKR